MPRRAYYDHEPAYLRRREEGYAGWCAPGTEARFEVFEEFLASELVPSPSGALDMGCGGGETVIRLAREGWKVTGVDFSETAIEMARINADKAGIDADFIVADLTKPLPVESGAFSLVVDHAALHCLIEREHRMAFLANAYRALRKGGIIFSKNNSAEGYVDYEVHQIDSKTRIASNHTRYWAIREEFEEAFTEAGFRIEHIEFKDTGEGYGASAIIYAVK